MMTSFIQLQKGLLLLDRDKVAEGEECLKSAIILAEKEHDEITLATAIICLGELYFLQKRIEKAVPLLERVSKIEREDDLLDHEVKKSFEILSEINMQ